MWLMDMIAHHYPLFHPDSLPLCGAPVARLQVLCQWCGYNPMSEHRGVPKAGFPLAQEEAVCAKLIAENFNVVCARLHDRVTTVFASQSLMRQGAFAAERTWNQCIFPPWPALEVYKR
jgi:hypothetical protein